MVCVDGYVTETSRHADVILPPVSALERGEVDVVFPLVSVRNTVRWNPAAVPKQEGGKEDWEILNGLTTRLGGGLLTKRRGASLAAHVASPARIVETAIATGPYGVLRRGPFKGLTIGRLKAAKHGIDLGSVEAAAARRAEDDDDRVALAPPAFMEAAAELEAQVAARDRDQQRRLRPDADRPPQPALEQLVDAQQPAAHEGQGPLHGDAPPRRRVAAGLEPGAQVKVVSRIGEIEVPLEVTEDIRPGVVSVPHGYGHGQREGVGWKPRRLAPRRERQRHHRPRGHRRGDRECGVQQRRRPGRGHLSPDPERRVERPALAVDQRDPVRLEALGPTVLRTALEGQAAVGVLLQRAADEALDLLRHALLAVN